MQAMCRLREDEPLPQKLLDKYWQLKRCMDRIQAALTLSDLARLCVECGYGKPLPEDNKQPTVADLWRKQQLQQGAAVVVEWRGTKVKGALHGVTSGNEIIVTLDGDPERRRFSVDRVTVAA